MSKARGQLLFPTEREYRYSQEISQMVYPGSTLRRKCLADSAR